MKWISTREAAKLLETSRFSIQVTACNYKKKYGQSPDWYKSLGINQESKVDIDYLLNIYDRERELHYKSIDLFYFLNEDMKISKSNLARTLSTESQVYSDFNSWLAFMSRALFTVPTVSFCDKITKLSEFHRIANIIANDYNASK